MKSIVQNKYSSLAFISKYFFILIISFSLTLPFLVFANHIPSHTGAPSTNNGAPSTGNGAPSTNNGAPSGLNVKIENPLSGNIKDLPSFLHEILRIVLYIGVPLVALAIIYCGFLFIKAQGNSEEIKSAKRTFVYTLVGGALLLGAWVIAEAIQGTVNDIISTT